MQTAAGIDASRSRRAGIVAFLPRPLPVLTDVCRWNMDLDSDMMRASCTAQLCISPLQH